MKDINYLLQTFILLILTFLSTACGVDHLCQLHGIRWAWGELGQHSKPLCRKLRGTRVSLWKRWAQRGDGCWLDPAWWLALWCLGLPFGLLRREINIMWNQRRHNRRKCKYRRMPLFWRLFLWWIPVFPGWLLTSGSTRRNFWRWSSCRRRNDWN